MKAIPQPSGLFNTALGALKNLKRHQFVPKDGIAFSVKPVYVRGKGVCLITGIEMNDAELTKTGG